MPEHLLEHVRQCLRSIAANTFLIGYSGGLDSHVLVHLCARLKDLGSFTAVHIDHGLQPQASQWSAHCRQICRQLDVAFESIAVEARPSPGQSPEEAARNARYQAFARRMRSGEVLLLAQHQDDQAETVLLQLLRGSGPAGLAGMPHFSPLGRGHILRPFLEIPRDSLKAYATAHRLQWVEDPSNLDLRLDRNYLRHQLMPLLVGRWPASARTIARSARHCGEAQSLIDQMADSLLEECKAQDGSLMIERLTTLDRRHQRHVVRTWLLRQQFRLPPEWVVNRTLDEIIPARGDRMPAIIWREGEIRRYRGCLHALPPEKSIVPQVSYPWNGRAALALENNGLLEAVPVTGAGIAADHWRNSLIEVRYRQGGETCRLPRRQGLRSMKKLMQEHHVPPWLRHRLPLVYLDGHLAAVPGYWVCDPFAAEENQEGVSVVWRMTRSADSRN